MAKAPVVKSSVTLGVHWEAVHRLVTGIVVELRNILYEELFVRHQHHDLIATFHVINGVDNIELELFNSQ